MSSAKLWIGKIATNKKAKSLVQKCSRLFLFRVMEESGRPRCFWKAEFASSNLAYPTLGYEAKRFGGGLQNRSTKFDSLHNLK